MRKLIEEIIEDFEKMKFRYYLTVANTGDPDNDSTYLNLANTIDGFIAVLKKGVKEMNNMEKYMEDIAGFACGSATFGVKKLTGKPANCIGLPCRMCLFDGPDDCHKLRLEWLKKEYVDKPVISKSDRAFLDYMVGLKYMVRRTGTGQLSAGFDKPIFDELVNDWRFPNTKCMSCSGLGIVFPMIKSSDEVPWSIDDLKQLEVCDNYDTF